MNKAISDRIEACKRKLLSAGYALSPGLENEDIAKIESDLQLSLPDVCKHVLLSFEIDISQPSPGYGSVVGEDNHLGEYLVLDICPAREWGELSRKITSDYRHLEENPLEEGHIKITGPAKPYLFGKGRVIFSVAHELFWAIDMSPAHGGNIGQILVIYPMYQTNSVVVVAPDYLTFLEKFADGVSK